MTVHIFKANYEHFSPFGEIPLHLSCSTESRNIVAKSYMNVGKVEWMLTFKGS